MNPTIILIGPIGTGKTTIGRLLAHKLNLPLCSIDDVREEYYERVGYDKSLASEIASSEAGLRGLLRYAEPFDAQMVKQILADYQNSIIDFGGSNSVYSDELILAQVEKALAPYPNIILLLPSPDTAETAEILKSRLITMLTKAGKSYSDDLFELNDYFIKHPSNRQLAKKVIYTNGKRPEAICNEILKELS
jgi:shikimate kinase